MALCKINHILSGCFVINCFRCPCTTCVQCTYIRYPRFGPVNKVCGLPDDKVTASRGSCCRAAPAATVVYAKVGCKKIELITFRRTQDVRIPDASLTYLADKHRLIIVKILEIVSVCTCRKVYLLMHRIPFTSGKASEQITGILILAYRSRCFHNINFNIFGQCRTALDNSSS